MTEKEIVKLLKSRFADIRVLMDKLSLTTPEQEENLRGVLDRMIQEGIVGRHDKSYYLLEDQHCLLAKVTAKARNFVVMHTIPDNYECKISGREADGLLVGDLVYVKEFQEGVFHCLDYLKAVDTLKGYYVQGRDGREQLNVPYLADCGKTVLVNGKSDDVQRLRPGDLCLGKIVNVNRDFIYCDIQRILVCADDVGSDISAIITMNLSISRMPSSRKAVPFRRRSPPKSCPTGRTSATMSSSPSMAMMPMTLTMRWREERSSTDMK